MCRACKYDYSEMIRRQQDFAENRCFVVNVSHVTFCSLIRLNLICRWLLSLTSSLFVLLAFTFPGSARCVPGYRCPNHHRGSHQGACSDSWTSSGRNRQSSRWRWWLVLGFIYDIQISSILWISVSLTFGLQGPYNPQQYSKALFIFI